MSVTAQAIITVAFWIATTMAKTSAAPTPPVDLKPLPASEIALRFANVSIDTVLTDRIEIFHAGGIYELQGRAVMWGNFTVADGRICVKTPPRPQFCRRVSADQAGDIYFLSEEAKSGRPQMIELRAFQ
jgi:hypothetical protein